MALMAKIMKKVYFNSGVVCVRMVRITLKMISKLNKSRHMKYQLGTYLFILLIMMSTKM